MAATAREIRREGCPVLLAGPFTGQIHDLGQWRSWVADLGGEPVRLVWIRTDASTLRHRLAERNLDRDAGKLAAFTAFADRMRPGEPPAAPHLTVDNSHGADQPLQDQIAAIAVES